MFKIVSRYLDKPRFSFGLPARHHLSVAYFPGLWSFPKIGKLFIFGSKPDAMDAIWKTNGILPPKSRRGIPSAELWWCEVGDVSDIRVQALDDTHIMDFWNGDGLIAPAHKGSLVTDRVMLVDRVWHNGGVYF